LPRFHIMHRPHLLSGEGRCPYRQDSCRQAQTRTNQHGLWAAEGRQRDTAPQQVRRSSSRQAHQQRRATRPEFKTCKFTTEAIVSEGIDKGEIRKVCTEPTCPVHHPKPRSQKIADDPKAKAQEERQRREVAIANTTGIRTLAAIAEAVPVRLLFAAYLRRAEESVLGSVLIEATILYMSTRHNPAQVLHEAATVYKVDTDAIALKVKQEFAAKDRLKKSSKAASKVKKTA
jgi:ParB family chromosome partitioning protein